MKNTFTNTKQKRSKEAIAPAQDTNPDVARGLRDLFEDELKDIFWAEKALTRTFSKMITNAQTPELINAISEHLDTTIGHVARLEKIFAILGADIVPQKCDVIYGLMRETKELIENSEVGLVRDFGIITIAQKVEHYEIASYSTLCAFAETLGETEAAKLLKLTLEEEKEAEEVLTSIARSSINIESTYEDYGYRTVNRRSA